MNATTHTAPGNTDCGPYTQHSSALISSGTGLTSVSRRKTSTVTHGRRRRYGAERTMTVDEFLKEVAPVTRALRVRKAPVKKAQPLFFDSEESEEASEGEEEDEEEHTTFSTTTSKKLSSRGKQAQQKVETRTTRNERTRVPMALRMKTAQPGCESAMLARKMSQLRRGKRLKAATIYLSLTEDFAPISPKPTTPPVADADISATSNDADSRKQKSKTKGKTKKKGPTKTKRRAKPLDTTSLANIDDLLRPSTPIQIEEDLTTDPILNALPVEEVIPCNGVVTPASTVEKKRMLPLSSMHLAFATMKPKPQAPPTVTKKAGHGFTAWGGVSRLGSGFVGCPSPPPREKERGGGLELVSSDVAMEIRRGGGRTERRDTFFTTESPPVAVELEEGIVYSPAPSPIPAPVPETREASPQTSGTPVFQVHRGAGRFRVQEESDEPSATRKMFDAIECPAPTFGSLPTPVGRVDEIGGRGKEGEEEQDLETVFKTLRVPARPASDEDMGEETCDADDEGEDMEEEEHARKPAPLTMGRLSSVAIGLPVRLSSKKRLNTEVSYVAESEMDVEEVMEDAEVVGESCLIGGEEDESLAFKMPARRTRLARRASMAISRTVSQYQTMSSSDTLQRLVTRAASPVPGLRFLPPTHTGGRKTSNVSTSLGFVRATEVLDTDVQEENVVGGTSDPIVSSDGAVVGGVRRSVVESDPISSTSGDNVEINGTDAIETSSPAAPISLCATAVGRRKTSIAQPDTGTKRRIILDDIDTSSSPIKKPNLFVSRDSVAAVISDPIFVRPGPPKRLGIGRMRSLSVMRTMSEGGGVRRAVTGVSGLNGTGASGVGEIGPPILSVGMVRRQSASMIRPVDDFIMEGAEREDRDDPIDSSGPGSSMVCLSSPVRMLEAPVPSLATTTMTTPTRKTLGIRRQSTTGFRPVPYFKSVDQPTPRSQVQERNSVCRTMTQVSPLSSGGLRPGLARTSTSVQRPRARTLSVSVRGKLTELEVITTDKESVTGKESSFREVSAAW
ncbi:hypothetical protein SAICODRAFT_20157 [Saitoella complicata NRRL Y-17804]|uniref:uncharacterized protein n=1 Tax=Saitoella complicata (strain BCRC 22490 / CBS 7301 / JCM 7358 / NBRC 10748 / NRRL Y-17804) TaxID=698492 RepID=UPI000866EF7A|nr:uncharacterized protein SAICODRAFT_20157 [Saitoella complicata NRRL Y-17804]ODQ52210.1 hypothetical protein SAICODRAFT_20157 [Saitoella complicata NRRL Y-17804]